MTSDGTWTYTWEHGRQLATASNGTTSVRSGAYGVGGSVYGITLDSKGNIGRSITVNGGGGFPCAGVGVFASANNSPTIYDQSGLGATVGVSGGPAAVAVGGDYNILIDVENNRSFHGGTVTASIGLYPTIVEVHGEVGNTWITNDFNIYDVGIKIAAFFIRNARYINEEK